MCSVLDSNRDLSEHSTGNRGLPPAPHVFMEESHLLNSHPPRASSETSCSSKSTTELALMGSPPISHLSIFLHDLTPFHSSPMLFLKFAIVQDGSMSISGKAVLLRASKNPFYRRSHIIPPSILNSHFSFQWTSRSMRPLGFPPYGDYISERRGCPDRPCL